MHWSGEERSRIEPILSQSAGIERSAAQMGLELCECHLDWVEVGRVRREIAQLRASGLDDLSDIVVLLGGQIVHHHDVAWLQGRYQTSLQVDAKNLAHSSARQREQ